MGGGLFVVVFVADLDLLLFRLALLLFLSCGWLGVLLGLALAENIVDVFVFLERLCNE